MSSFVTIKAIDPYFGFRPVSASPPPSRSPSSSPVQMNEGGIQYVDGLSATIRNIHLEGVSNSQIQRIEKERHFRLLAERDASQRQEATIQSLLRSASAPTILSTSQSIPVAQATISQSGSEKQIIRPIARPIAQLPAMLSGEAPLRPSSALPLTSVGKTQFSLTRSDSRLITEFVEKNGFRSIQTSWSETVSTPVVRNMYVCVVDDPDEGVEHYLVECGMTEEQIADYLEIPEKCVRIEKGSGQTVSGAPVSVQKYRCLYKPFT